jgi:hypothetical protein
VCYVSAAIRQGTIFMVMPYRWVSSLALASVLPFAAVAADSGYRQPPEPLLGVMRAPLNPSPRLDPTGKTLLLVQRNQYPPIARVAEPYLKLAGVRVEPRSHSRHDMSNGYGIRTCLDGFALVDVASGKQTAVTLPSGDHTGNAGRAPFRLQQHRRRPRRAVVGRRRHRQRAPHRRRAAQSGAGRGDPVAGR